MEKAKKFSTGHGHSTRRKVILAAGRGMLCLAAASFAVFVPARASDREDALLRLLDDRRAARMIGLRARTTLASDTDRVVLTELLARRLGLDDGAGLPGPEELRRRMAAAVRDDFAGGRTCTVDGWVLSLTEARLCSLAAAA